MAFAAVVPVAFGSVHGCQTGRVLARQGLDRRPVQRHRDDLPQDRTELGRGLTAVSASHQLRLICTLANHALRYAQGGVMNIVMVHAAPIDPQIPRKRLKETLIKPLNSEDVYLFLAIQTNVSHF